MKKALIFDLDDTIYPSKSVADKMFAELYALIQKHVSEDVYEKVKEDILTSPFQKVADRYKFSKELKQKGMKLSEEMEYHEPIKTFDDYSFIKDLNIDKFLVTAGYTKLQKSKIKQLGIEKDFKEIFISDPAKTGGSKTEVFESILNKYHYQPSEVLVIGDNPEAEITAAKELNLDTYLYDAEKKYSPALADYYGNNYSNLKEIVG
ncbi:HAD family hydrolase [uncultured Mucilaginibacter sp.]|uniref:HAD family hydrolase n=1 Tax=uncultured Mucilaginibacter sp. TaxID=797541 RepID=UPI002636956C|nr:HAD family hydrolase [uncultured Mucilaginibacter sp.]